MLSNTVLYHLMLDNKVISISVGYVNDLLRCGTAEFRNIANNTHESFDMGPTSLYHVLSVDFIFPRTLKFP